MTNMRKTQNEPIQAWELAVMFAAVLGLCLIFMSCSTAKKNEKAYQRVLTDSTMFRSIGQKFMSLQKGCSNDTIVGETEVLILSDTVQLAGNTDTLNRVDTIRITQVKTKTETKYVIDNRAIHELQDTMHALQLRQAAHSGIVAQLSQDRKQAQDRANFEAKRAKRAGLLMWGILAAALISHLLRSFPSIRKAIGI